MQHIFLHCFRKKCYLFYVEAISILLNGEINTLHFLASVTPLNPVLGSFPFPPPPTPLSFSFFHFLASDTSSSSLSRTESPLQVFVSSHLPHPHPKSDTFVWPHAASPYCDQVPEPCSPSRCKLVFSS